MSISLFGLNNSEKKKPKVNCKCKFEIERLTIKISKDINQNNFELFFSFQLSLKKGQIAFSILEANLINKNNQSQQIYIHLTFNENTNYFNGCITLNNSEVTNSMLNKIKIKIVNLCNDTTVFKLKNKDNLDINNHEVDIENEKFNLI